MQRMNMGIAIVCMINNTALSAQSHAHEASISSAVTSSYLSNQTTSAAKVEPIVKCAFDPSKNSHVIHFESRLIQYLNFKIFIFFFQSDGEFTWDKSKQGIFLNLAYSSQLI